MKVTYNWLKDFVDIKIPAQTLANKLTMAGLEVTSFTGKEGDFIFEIEVTSNRPDCLCVIGIAREVAAITGKKIRVTPPVSHSASKSLHQQELNILIENKKDCPLYTAKIIKNVKVGPSPEWLRKRLELVGCRSINNIVDITNYVLFETGEPLHAFDLDKLTAGAIIVRRAKNNEKITTIDGVQRILNPETLLIADKAKAVAIAGIMGGKDTEVTEVTRKILLEAAVFNPLVIRRARQKLGIQTDSSYRFERGVHVETVQNASLRAAGLIQELCNGKLVTAKSSGLPAAKRKTIFLENSTVIKILGARVAAAKTKSILRGLGFSVKVKKKDKFSVAVPTFRPDLNLAIDLIEEIARIFGYENIPSNLPPVQPYLSIGERRDLVSLVKNILVGLGLKEAITYTLMDRDLLPSFTLGRAFHPAEILNPLSKEQGVLRPTLLPGLMASVAHNLNQKEEYVNIFEIANIFHAEKNSPQEELALAIALSGKRSFLTEEGIVKDETSLLHLKGILEVLFERLGIKDYSFTTGDNPSLVNINIRAEKVGLMANLAKNTLDRFDIKHKHLFVAELSLDRCLKRAELKKKFLPLPKYPGVIRDISFILKEEIPIKKLLEAMEMEARPLLQETRITDYYKGKQIPAGHRGLTVSCLYRADERTLTEAEVTPLHNRICSILAERFGAGIR